MKNSVLFALLMSLFVVVWAHQPFPEKTETTYQNIQIFQDPEVSIAMYASLDFSGDVDYFAFEGFEGIPAYLSVVIPVIPGQEDFAPDIEIAGPFPAPKLSVEEEFDGRMVYTLVDDQASPTVFFEPFSRTSYWERQEVWLELPVNGWYIVRVSDGRQRTGRYVLAMGTKEVFGGDLLFLIQFKRTYWKPVE
ncbi:MAG TPA: hypothetical protein PKM99_09085 [Thermotogota bacterium]|nr:hypothetical protein [Thermotogota bacterium]